MTLTCFLRKRTIGGTLDFGAKRVEGQTDKQTTPLESVTSEGGGAAAMAQWLQHVLLLQRIGVWFPELTTTYNPSSSKSDASGLCGHTDTP